MMYALHCLQLSPGNVHLLQKTIMRHCRAIVSDQAFLTGITHDEIMQKYQIRSACSILEHAHGRELGLEQYEDWMIDVTWNKVISDGLQVAAQHTEPESDAEQEVWACPVCDEQFSNIAALKIHARRAHRIVDTPARLFDRTKHALHGLPQCAGCLRKFSRWQTLEAHVNNNSCPARVQDVCVAKTIVSEKYETNPVEAACTNQAPPNVSGPPTLHSAADATEQSPQSIDFVNTGANCTIPICRQALVKDLIARGLNSFIHQPAITQQLLQHCAICGQWIASHRVMKTHYKNTHKALLQQRQDLAQKLIAQKATPSVSCHFCRKRTKDWKAHLHKCTALWQCAIMCATPQDARTGHGGLLRGLSGHGDNGGGHGTIGTATQSLSCSKQAPQGAFQFVSADTLTFPGRLPRSISAETTPSSAQSGQRPLSVYFGQGRAQATGRTSGSAPGLGLHSLHEAGGDLGDEPSLPDGPQLQDQVGSRPAVEGRPTPASHGANGRALQGADGSSQPDLGLSGAAQEGDGPGLAERGRLAISAVEPNPETFGGRHSQSTDPGRPTPGSAGNHPSVFETPDCEPLQMQVQTHGNHDDPSNLRSRCIHEGAQLHYPLGSSTIPPKQRGTATHRHQLQDGEPGKEQPGAAHPELDVWMKGANRGIARRATQLILRNDGNACYMNSLVQVMLWLLECLQIRTLSSENDLESFFLSLMQSNDRTPLSLLHHPRWQSVIRNWGEAHRQHDVCEFFAHIMHTSDCGLFAGLWKAFTPAMAGHTHLLDEGPCTQPIILHLPQATRDSTPPRIQRLVDEWHRCVDRIHGLYQAPAVILFQLHRFTRQRNRIYKNHAKVLLDDFIRVPVLQATGSATHTVPYKLCAFIEHHGNTPLTGHYTANLVQDTLWCCDDDRVAQQRAGVNISHQKSCYALFYCLQQALPELAGSSSS